MSQKKEYPDTHCSARNSRNSHEAARVDEETFTASDIQRMIQDKCRRVVVIHGKVLDVTYFADHHPGGPGPFEVHNGEDVSDLFDQSHSVRAVAQLRHWTIGSFAKEQARPPPSASSQDPISFTSESIATYIAADPKAILLVFFGGVYNVTDFARDHPGGTHVLTSNNGSECGDAFMRIHGPRAKEMAKKYFIGTLVDSKYQSSPLLSTAAVKKCASLPPNWRATRLLSSEARGPCHSVRYLTFAIPDRMNVVPGGHIRIYRDVEKRLGRFYTPFSTEIASFSVCVKRYKRGEISNYLCDLHEGDEIVFDGPFAPSWMASDDPLLRCSSLAAKRVLLLAAGTGTSPLYTIAKDLLERSVAHVVLCISVQSAEDILLGDELEDLMKLYGKPSVPGRCAMELFFAFSKPTTAKKKLQWATGIFEGRLSVEIMRRVNGTAVPAQAVLICGSPSYNEEIPNHVTEAGVAPADRVHIL